MNRSTETPPAKYITFRGYDGMNRLQYIGETLTENYIPGWENLNPQPGQNYGFENYSLSPGNFLTVNVYDTLANYPANANIFTSGLPQDYYGEENNTKGSLTATAYRTKGEENWSYKYYRYDSRGRVKKMWNYISGLGMKVTYYYYNSQNQLTMLKYQNTNDNDYRAYYYNYDFAGRLQSVSTDQSGPPPDYIVPFAEYSYNENSQISQTKYNNNSYNITNTYNNRNWLTQSTSSNGMFEFTLGYLSNGNITTQYLTGSYRSNFPDLRVIKSSNHTPTYS